MKYLKTIGIVFFGTAILGLLLMLVYLQIKPQPKKDLGSYFSQVTLADGYGNEIEGTMLNQLKVAQSIRIAGGVFSTNTLDSNFFSSSTANGGSASVSTSEAICNLTTTSNSSCGITTVGIGRYIGNNENYFRAVIRLGDTGNTNNTRQWGLMDTLPGTDGSFFQLSSTTLSVVTRRSGVDTVVTSTSWNTPVVMDTNYNTYEVYLTHRRIQFVVNGTLVYTAQATTKTLLGTSHLRPFIRTFNTGVGVNSPIYSSVLAESRLGEAVTQPKSFYRSGTTAGVILKTGPGSIHSLHISGMTNGTVITLYDNTSASGTILYSTGTITIGTGDGANNTPFDVKFDGTGGIPFTNGLTLTITTANSNVTTLYE